MSKNSNAQVKQAVMTKISNPNEIKVNVNDKEVIVYKNSNKFKVNEKEYFLSNIVWDEVTDEILNEIKKQLSKK